jgi:predicted TIM-barrel fold metal-dependent hydrolase
MCEISFFPHAKRLYQLVKKGLVNKLLFGSDLIIEDDEQSLKGYLAVINQARISSGDVEKILYKNAEKLL